MLGQVVSVGVWVPQRQPRPHARPALLSTVTSLIAAGNARSSRASQLLLTNRKKRGYTAHLHTHAEVRIPLAPLPLGVVGAHLIKHLLQQRWRARGIRLSAHPPQRRPLLPHGAPACCRRLGRPTGRPCAQTNEAQRSARHSRPLRKACPLHVHSLPAAESPHTTLRVPTHIHSCPHALLLKLLHSAPRQPRLQVCTLTLELPPAR